MPDLTQYTSMDPPKSQPAHSKNGKRLWLFIGGGVVAALAVAAGVYWFVLREHKAAPAPAKTTQQTTTQQERSSAATPADSTPVTYKSTKLNIEITHRKDWSMTESADAKELV